MADSTVQVHDTDEEVQGQGQKVRLRELHAVTDEVILDPESEKAVQIPEHHGASSVGEEIELAAALRRGTAEEQLSGASPEEVDNTRPARKSEKASK